MKHMNNHKNCVLRLPKITCPVCGKDIEIPRGQTSKDVLKKHISETHRETPKDTPPPSTEQPPHVTNEWLIRLYHTSYAVFMEQHDGMGLSPLSRHCLVGIVREFKFENGYLQNTIHIRAARVHRPHHLIVACVMQMSTIEIVCGYLSSSFWMVSTWSESHAEPCNYGILYQTVSHGGLHHVFGISEFQVGRFYQEIQRVGHIRSSAALPVDND